MHALDIQKTKNKERKTIEETNPKLNTGTHLSYSCREGNFGQSNDNSQEWYLSFDKLTITY